ncbi:integrase arm-type DNA-binding domain-containing protein [Aliarcobacter cryaerophilus]|uniref:tyrosine-type recombinase/integrase n=1 Tax=Aliarcobacter cryaerophilus TaxID=28198 RepID=UPI0021B6AD8F|nr:integrase arm-type DNA-binding domain-containing protein [Aliarcobacter cryaerophilus]MCT7517366.1 integrase arm-type DNA-binding domain-containing protein [Aliarcobacter cryaerophilus]
MASLNILNDVMIKKAKVENKDYSLNDGGGLSLKIKTNGNKIWEFRYTLNKKRRETTFKSYPMVTLKNARQKRDEYLDLIAQNIDPIEYYKIKKEESIKDIKGMFLSVANEWLLKEKEHLKETTYKGKLKVFENDVYPFLKNKHIKDIEIKDIIKVLDIKQIQSVDVASKIFNYFDNLFRYSVLKGYCERNIIADIRKSDIIKPKRVRHFPKITDEKNLKELIDSIYNYKGSLTLRNVLKLVLHIPLRAENLCTIKWSYINFDEKSLTIPRVEMKVDNHNLEDFKVPLTDEVISILNDQKPFTEHQEYVFLGRDNRNHINKESPNKALKIMGFNDEEKGRKIRLHGFRGTFRSMIDTLDIENKFSFELKERILDHHETNETVRAYNHKANYFEQFKLLMNFWSKYILNLKG